MNQTTSSPVRNPRHMPGSHCPLFSDAVAIADQRLGLVTWTSPAWGQARPDLATGSTLANVTAAIPALAAALQRAARARRRPDKGQQPALANTQSDKVVDTGQHWHVDVDVDALDDERIAIRLSDRREHGLTLQRQLDDREQLLFTSRVLSVGEMATTLAHELNQPIAAAANLLRGLRSRLTRRFKLAGEEAAALDRTIEQIMFAAQVIARIRDFTQSHKPRPARIDLAALVETSASLLDWDLQRAGVELVVDGTDTPVTVCGDSVMLQQVLINLIRNGIDAMRNDPPAAPRLMVRLVTDQLQAELQVSDNGCGLDDQVAQKLFVPFASSKPNGMGLGLSICRSFIELHQGRLWFSRNQDRGATFHVALPLQGDLASEGAMQ